MSPLDEDFFKSGTSAATEILPEESEVVEVKIFQVPNVGSKQDIATFVDAG